MKVFEVTNRVKSHSQSKLVRFLYLRGYAFIFSGARFSSRCVTALSMGR